MDSLVLPDEEDTPRELLALIEGAESRSLGSVVRRSLDEVDRNVRDAVLLAIESDRYLELSNGARVFIVVTERYRAKLAEATKN